MKQKIEAAKGEFERIYSEKTKGFPLIAKAYADYITYNDEQAAKELIQKTHPAIVAAEKVKEIILQRNRFFNTYPAARVNPEHGNLYWFLDEDAASLL